MKLLLSIFCLLTIFTSEVILDFIPQTEVEISINDPIEGESEIELEEESKVHSSLHDLDETEFKQSAYHNFTIVSAYIRPIRHKIQGPPPDYSV